MVKYIHQNHEDIDMSHPDTQLLLKENRIKENNIVFKCFIILLNLSFFAAIPIARSITGVSDQEFINNLFTIFTGPSKLVTDYFALGCIPSTLLNAGLCGLACTILIISTRVQANSTTFAAYILVIAH